MWVTAASPKSCMISEISITEVSISIPKTMLNIFGHRNSTPMVTLNFDRQDICDTKATLTLRALPHVDAHVDARCRSIPTQRNQ